jgi:murein DD-endopeptidase MepM/ murein hydrolase activator NlpD
MKHYLLPILIACILNSTLVTAQSDSLGSGNEIPYNNYSASTSEISSDQYSELERRCNVNSARFINSSNIQKSSTSVALGWPLKAAPGFTDCEFHFIGAYVDHNAATGAVTDYNCESNTYDGHHGTDIAAWPFAFYKMENSFVQIVAAAAGTIIDKHDGEYDRNCVGVGSNVPANYVIIQHADGSRALYWHMKNTSVTSKAIGQQVSEGEYLGVVGSSGSSSGPHLHFEVWSGSSASTYNDPFAGACNKINATSWWANQRPHTEPAVVKASVHTTDVVFATCPETGTITESTSFAVPFQGPGLSPGYAKFYIYLREASVGSTVNLSILNPDASTFASWTYPVTTYYKTLAYQWSKKLPTIPGDYTFQTNYNGKICSSNFKITSATELNPQFSLNQIKILPIPIKETSTLKGENIENGHYKITIQDITGQILYCSEIDIESMSINLDLPTKQLVAGYYIISVETANKRIIRKVFKI